MSKKTVLLIVTLLAIVIVTVAQAQATSNLYLPLVMKFNTPTPTRTRQPTATVSPTPSTRVVLVHIEARPNGDAIQDEYISIKNQSNKAVVMTGWTIRDEPRVAPTPTGRPRPTETGTVRHIYSFPSGFTLAAGATVRVWSGTGGNTTTDLYWRSDEQIWNDGSDCAYLRDKDKVLIDQECY
jgi:competence protein ComEC